MRHQEQPPPPQWADKYSRRHVFDLVVQGVYAGGAVAMSFTRFGHGIDQPGMPGLIAFVGLLFYAIQAGSHSCLIFWEIWTVATVIFAFCRDRMAHALYLGRVRVLWRYMGERSAAALEAALVFALGFVVHVFDQQLGLIFIVSGACLGLSECLVRQLIRRRIIAARNILEEARLDAELFNELTR